jgi:hypothetical protein
MEADRVPGLQTARLERPVNESLISMLPMKSRTTTEENTQFLTGKHYLAVPLTHNRSTGHGGWHFAEAGSFREFLTGILWKPAASVNSCLELMRNLLGMHGL